MSKKSCQAMTQAAKTTLFAAGSKADVRKNRRRRLFANELAGLRSEVAKCGANLLYRAW
jgi:hypothetical protein